MCVRSRTLISATTACIAALRLGKSPVLQRPLHLLPNLAELIGVGELQRSLGNLLDEIRTAGLKRSDSLGEFLDPSGADLPAQLAFFERQPDPAALLLRFVRPRAG
jgi:hypothetical protein